MKIQFEPVSLTEIKIIGVDGDIRKEIGLIFSPAGSANENLNAIQVCGFSQAFDLWGCARYKIPKLARSDVLYARRRDIAEPLINGNPAQMAKDIQLLFKLETEPAKQDDVRADLIEDCLKCYNRPCTCEIHIQYENPYTVKRAQDLRLEQAPPFTTAGPAVERAGKIVKV